MARICTELNSANVTAGNAIATATVTCTGNDFAISGDALLNIGAGNVDQVFRSEPTATGNGWRVPSRGWNWRKPSHIPSSSNLLC